MEARFQIGLQAVSAESYEVLQLMLCTSRHSSEDLLFCFSIIITVLTGRFSASYTLMLSKPQV